MNKKIRNFLDLIEFEEKSLGVEILTPKDKLYLASLEESYIDDKNIMRKVLKYDCNRLDIASERIKDDKDFLIETYKDLSIGRYRYFSERLKKDIDLINLEMRYPYNFRYLLEEFRNDPKYIHDALPWKSNLKYIGEKIKDDKPYMFQIYCKYQQIYRFLPYKITEEFIIEGLNKYPSYIVILPKKWIKSEILSQCNQDILKYILEIEPANLSEVLYIGRINTIRNCKEMFNYISKLDISLLKYIPTIKNLETKEKIKEIAKKEYFNYIDSI